MGRWWLEGLGARIGRGYEQQSCLTAGSGAGGKAALPSLGAVQEYCSGRLGAVRLRPSSAEQAGSPAGKRAPALWHEASPSYLQAERF